MPMTSGRVSAKPAKRSAPAFAGALLEDGDGAPPPNVVSLAGSRTRLRLRTQAAFGPVLADARARHRAAAARRFRRIVDLGPHDRLAAQECPRLVTRQRLVFEQRLGELVQVVD